MWVFSTLPYLNHPSKWHVKIYQKAANLRVFVEPSIASSRGFCKAGRLWERHQGDRPQLHSPGFLPGRVGGSIQQILTMYIEYIWVPIYEKTGQNPHPRSGFDVFWLTMWVYPKMLGAHGFIIWAIYLGVAVFPFFRKHGTSVPKTQHCRGHFGSKKSSYKNTSLPVEQNWRLVCKAGSDSCRAPDTIDETREPHKTYGELGYPSGNLTYSHII